MIFVFFCFSQSFALDVGGANEIVDTAKNC